MTAGELYDSFINRVLIARKLAHQRVDLPAARCRRQPWSCGSAKKTKAAAPSRRDFRSSRFPIIIVLGIRRLERAPGPCGTVSRRMRMPPPVALTALSGLPSLPVSRAYA